MYTSQKSYTMRGYAYTGGGHKVTRVEVSFDQGKTWELCELEHLPPNHAGKHWCWCHWTYEAPMKYMLAAANSHIRCRAWDQTSNTQPFELVSWIRKPRSWALICSSVRLRTCFCAIM